MKALLFISLFALVGCNSGNPDKKSTNEITVTGYSCDQLKQNVLAIGNPMPIEKIRAVMAAALQKNPAFTTELQEKCLGDAFTAECDNGFCIFNAK